MKSKRIFPWLLAGIVSIAGLIETIYFLPQELDATNNHPLVIVLSIMYGVLLPLFSSCLAALIVTRQPGNTVGWLVMVTAITTVSPFTQLIPSSQPSAMTFSLWLLLWLEGWIWVLQSLAFALIPLYFPNGGLPSPRWRWINKAALGILFFWILLSAIWPELEADRQHWIIENPLGISIPESLILGSIIATGVLFVIMAAAGVGSLFLRFRRGSSVERQQIKWLLFAGALFIPVFVINTVYYAGSPSRVLWANMLMVISFLMLPIAIAIAILRFRLYEIDLIIRRTLQYTILTGSLALVYFGSVVLLQNLFVLLTGEQSPVVIVVSTLVIAALFTPLRVRIQKFIDRRFYREKYDAEQALANFATIARDEVDLDNLSASLMGVVRETVQPEQISLWLISLKAEEWE